MSDLKPPADRAAAELDFFFQLTRLATQTAMESNDIRTAAAHFQQARDMTEMLEKKVKELRAHVDQISQHMLPTLFFNKGVKGENLIGIGRVTINQRWTAKMLNPAKCMEWLRLEGNGGIIRETVHHETLGATARVAAMEGHPLPHDLFEVGTSNYTSVTKS